jgi:DNA-binding NtrC family response regulator
MENNHIEIVVVDDEEQITELIEIFIQSAGKKTNVHTFNDPRKARDFIKNNKVDVLITDYKMPHVNGLDLLKIASSATKKILISGYVTEIAEDCLNQMNALFFEKPVPMKELREIIFK